jgi:hypothetical protein
MFKPNHDSFYKNYANQTLDWLQMDNEDLYKKNLKENYDLLETNGWINQKFTYKFNSHGFRCDEFSIDPTIMFLGCSNTCGVGLPVDTIWPEIVSKNLNMRCANLGIGAGSNDTTFRLCDGWIDRINPQIVILLRTYPHRLELVDSSTIYNLSLTRKNLDEVSREFLTKWSTDDNNGYFNDLKNHLAIQHICASRNIKFLSLEPTQLYHVDTARDLSHCGKNSNKMFADTVLSKM